MHAFVDWLLVLALYLAVALLAAHTAIRTDLLERIFPRHRSPGFRALDDRDPDDLDAPQVFQILRTDRLRSDLDRLRRLVAVDESMSATRQLANRMAYRQLQQQVLAECGPSALEPPAAVSRGYGAIRERPQPEVLDFGRR